MKIDKQSHGWARVVWSAVVEEGVREILQFEIRGGEPALLKLPSVELTDSKEGKPIGIQTHIGRRQWQGGRGHIWDEMNSRNSNREPRFRPCKFTNEK